MIKKSYTWQSKIRMKLLIAVARFVEPRGSCYILLVKIRDLSIVVQNDG